ncbi:MAG: hypothetical protein KDA22_03285, partial [Phycisphaerales bacterium]|nr:hypothetical protein [Phycisphaerales bacterium]
MQHPQTPSGPDRSGTVPEASEAPEHSEAAGAPKASGSLPVFVQRVGGRDYSFTGPLRTGLFLLVAPLVVLAITLNPIHLLGPIMVLIGVAGANPRLSPVGAGCLPFLIVTGVGVGAIVAPETGLPLLAWATIAWLVASIDLRLQMKPYRLPGDDTLGRGEPAPSIAMGPVPATRVARAIRIERLLGFACLAVFASVVATWTLAVCAPITIAPLPAFPSAWLAPVPAGWPPPSGFSISAQGPGAMWVIQSFDTPDAVGASNATSLEQPRSGGQVTIQAGWPFRALQADVTGPRVDSTSPHRPLQDHATWTARWRAGISLPELVAVGAPGLGRPIPLVPI